jgi:hypothetical protein
VGLDPNEIKTCYNIGNLFMFLILEVYLNGLVFIIGIKMLKGRSINVLVLFV